MHRRFCNKWTSPTLKEGTFTRTPVRESAAIGMKWRQDTSKISTPTTSAHLEKLQKHCHDRCSEVFRGSLSKVDMTGLLVVFSFVALLASCGCIQDPPARNERYLDNSLPPEPSFDRPIGTRTGPSPGAPSRPDSGAPVPPAQAPASRPALNAPVPPAIGPTTRPATRKPGSPADGPPVPPAIGPTTRPATRKPGFPTDGPPAPPAIGPTTRPATRKPGPPAAGPPAPPAIGPTTRPAPGAPTRSTLGVPTRSSRGSSTGMPSPGTGQRHWWHRFGDWNTVCQCATIHHYHMPHPTFKSKFYICDMTTRTAFLMECPALTVFRPPLEVCARD